MNIPAFWNPSSGFPSVPNVLEGTQWSETLRPRVSEAPSNHLAVPVSLDHVSSYQALIEVIERIAAYADLPDDWDSYGGVGPTEHARKSAQNFVLELFGENLLNAGDTVDILPVPTGGIQFEWAGIGGEIEVEIDHRGDVHSLIEHADGRYEASSSDTPVPWPAVRDQIRRIVG